MAVNGNINVNVSFLDKDEQDNVDTEKTITLSSSQIYTAGKVAIVSGTCGTASVSVSFAPTTYANASGQIVSFASVNRIAIKADGNVVVLSASQLAVRASAGHCSVTELSASDSSGPVDLRTTSGTAAYTVVLYGT